MGFLDKLFGGNKSNKSNKSKPTRESVAAAAEGGSFSKQDLGGLDLSGIEFLQATFNEATLFGSNLSGATFTQCELKKANMRNATLAGARFAQCEFKGAIFDGANVVGATFEQCEFPSAKLDSVQGAEQATFSQCALAGTALAAPKSPEEQLSDQRARQYDQAVQAAAENGDVNAMLAAAQAQTKQIMQDAIKPEQLEPIGGVSLEVYATVSARVAADPSARPAILAEYGLDEARFNAADQGWQARMRQAEDPMAAAAIAGEYGKYFAAAGQGQYGATAQASAGHIGMHGQVGGPGAAAEPCTLERYAEIMGAQAAWSDQGRDVNAMLQSQFGMTALDWSNMSTYWSMKMATDYQLAQRLTDLQAQYEQRYRGAGGGPDDDLSF